MALNLHANCAMAAGWLFWGWINVERNLRMAPNYSKHSHCNGQDDCLYNHVFIIWSVPVEFIAINATSKPNELLMTLMFFTLHWNRNAINCQTRIKEQIRLLENELVCASWKWFTHEFQHRVLWGDRWSKLIFLINLLKSIMRHLLAIIHHSETNWECLYAF